jgi:hypothetical protein
MTPKTNHNPTQQRHAVNPFVVLHEFYHHLRCKGVDRMHRGTEGNADRFALDFIKAYQETAKKIAESNQ